MSSLSSAGHQVSHATGVQVSRAVGVVHAQDLLDEDAHFPGRRGPSEGELWRRRQGHHLQRRQDAASGRGDDQAPLQRRSGVLWRLAQLLQPEAEGGVARDQRSGVWPHLYGGGGLWSTVLQQGLHQGAGYSEGELQVQVHVVLWGHLRDVRVRQNDTQVLVKPGGEWRRGNTAK